MANEKRLIAENDIYALFGQNGRAMLHVGDIDVLPRVDAVEVVRCKGCKYFTYDGYHKHYYCSRAKGLRYAILPDDFCSCGEKESRWIN